MVPHRAANCHTLRPFTEPDGPCLAPRPAPSLHCSHASPRLILLSTAHNQPRVAVQSETESDDTDRTPNIVADGQPERAMVAAPPPLPTRFPCWCRAVYSWGGESSRDLGFIEGDLIECLNAGDGSWWTGRLRRNKTVGVFPSNFVEVLPDDFRPISRSISPLTSSNTPSPTSSLQKTKSKPFRKPFEAYAKAPHYTTAKQPEIIRQPTNAPLRKNSTVRRNSVRARGSISRPPLVNREYAPRVPSPAPPRHLYQRGPSPAPPITSDHIQSSPVRPYRSEYNHRAPSPAPPFTSYHPRAVSPAPPPISSYGQRTPSPFPPQMSSYGQRTPSPAPHMTSYGQRAHSPAPPQVPNHYPREPSPAPPPIQHYRNRTPSPAPPLDESRGPSPAPSFSFKPYRPGAEHDSPPPPAPPPHRSLIVRRPSNASYDGRPHQEGYHTPRAVSPVPPSPAGMGLTPSPLREAMDGVIEQLDALGMPRESRSPETPFDPWSPESFDMVHHRSRRKQLSSQTSLGLGHQDSGYESYGGESSLDNTIHGGHKDENPLPQLDNYVDRMETRLRRMHEHKLSSGSLNHDLDPAPPPPLPPLKSNSNRPKSSVGDDIRRERSLQKKKSSYDVGLIGRTATTKTNSTNASSGNQSSTTTNSATTQSTHRSLMSGTSAGGISSTSAGSLARRNRALSALDFRSRDDDWDPNRPTTPFTGVSYHPSHSTSALRPQSQVGFNDDGIGAIGGLVQPGAVKPKRANFIKRILEATKTGVASGRSSIATGTASLQSSPTKRSGPDGVTAIAGGLSTPNAVRDAAREMGLDSGVDWVQIRRDVNRSNTLSRNERNERRDRCQMMDYPAIDPVDELYESIEGDEGADGHPVREPTNYQGLNLSQVDKNSRFVSNLPPMTTAVALATNYVCRPYRSDVQRLRAIFVWVAEQVHWEEDFEGEVDTRRVIQIKHGCAEEYAVLVHEMCAAIGIHSEIVRGYLKTPGEVAEANMMPRPNHWWNAVLVDDEWRMMDCCLASPSNPRRGLYSNAGSGTAEFWWFLIRPTELCWTHIPEHHAQQHICPPVAYETLLNLPAACAPYFKNEIAMVDFNTSLLRIEDLEMLHIKFNVPGDVEVAAEVEVRAYSRDSDGDLFESGDVVKKRALAQAEWYNGVKRYTVKALLPGDEGTGVLKVYAGKRGLMHSIKDIPHPLAFALPIVHTGENPPYEFVTRHPTPHAQRHDIYVVQPQCQRLALNNTFVFAIRQHPNMGNTHNNNNNSSSGNAAPPNSNNHGATSPLPFARPASAMSVTSSAATSAPSSATGSIAGKKPAKLAIQTPGGKILRLMRKEERRGVGIGAGGGGGGGGRAFSAEDEVSDGGTWETIIKCSERGVWRGLVLADRTARWCVFAEWVCVG
ncbi:putative cytokinesis protein Cyk3 [Rosellinia necatrix]|uniref:Putative cytokinesis protein Cyk3 n=1 Tax=Rosellinia necatrix TaxID=77044 RepID=A0A1S7UL95_ROSNE|nr:putative cytokinesis protein Cyk3 [Rosellinia necatrix]